MQPYQKISLTRYVEFHPPPPSPTLLQLPAAPPAIKNTDLFKTEVDLFGNDEAVGLFGDKIVEDNKHSIYKSYV